MRNQREIRRKSAFCALAVLAFGLASTAGDAQAQQAQPVLWRADGLATPEAPAPLPQFIQQDLGRGAWDRDPGPRGWRMNRPEDDEHRHDSGRSGGPESSGRMRPDMMRPPMMGQGMMAMGGARFHMRRGDAEIDVRCPADVRMSDCVEAIGKMIDRLGALGSGAPR